MKPPLEIEFMVVRAIRKKANQHPSAIHRMVVGLSGGRWVPSYQSVLDAIHRAVKDGRVEGRPVGDAPIAPRIVYRLTAEGRKWNAKQLAAIRSFLDGKPTRDSASG